MRMPRRSEWLQTSAILALGAAYCVLMVVHAGNARSESFFSPLAYMALVLSALWWGRKGVLMAGILAAVPLAARIWLVATPDPWGDSARLVSFFVVALGLGAVRDQALAAHRACRASERRYRDIVEKSLSGIVIYSDEGILYANPRIQEFMGYRFDEVAGRPFWDFIHKDDQPKVRELVASRKNAAASDLRYDCRLVAKDGRTVWGDIASSLVEYEGKRAVLASVYDISEMERIEAKHQELSRLARKQEEQLVHSTRLAEMGEMAAGIAHELNQPLTGIKNYAQNASYMLRENVGDVAENLRLIAGQVDRASRIIAQMRELARRSERQFALVDINQKLVETVEFVMPQLRLSGVSVSHSLAEDLPPGVRGRNTLRASLSESAHERPPSHGGHGGTPARNPNAARAGERPPRRHRDRRYGQGIRSGNNRKAFRALLQHQEEPPRHRPGTLDIVEHRQRPQRQHRSPQRRWARRDLHGTFARRRNCGGRRIGPGGIGRIMSRTEQRHGLVAVIDDDEAAPLLHRPNAPTPRLYRRVLLVRGGSLGLAPAYGGRLRHQRYQDAWNGRRGVLEEAMRRKVPCPIVMITGHGDVAMAVRCLKTGAYDFIEKPFEDDFLLARVQRAVEKSELQRESEELRRRLSMLPTGEDGRFGMVGRSPAMQDVYEQIEMAARSDAPVLVVGETGVGKELAARAIHSQSRRADGPFVAANAGALPEALLESELFGHARGAFTGATEDRDGKLVAATGGSLLLDEVESISERAQLHLLRVLEDGMVEPLGKDSARRVDVRLLATTKVDLARLVRDGDMREDFYHRIVVLRVFVPPLRERADDIPLFVSYFARRIADRYGVPAPVVPESVLARLLRYEWPGNVRELRNAVERMVLTAADGVAGEPDLDSPGNPTRLLSLPATAGRLRDEMERTESAVIEAALREQRGEGNGHQPNAGHFAASALRAHEEIRL